jgi:hypothetical protein
LPRQIYHSQGYQRPDKDDDPNKDGLPEFEINAQLSMSRPMKEYYAQVDQDDDGRMRDESAHGGLFYRRMRHCVSIGERKTEGSYSPALNRDRVIT